MVAVPWSLSFRRDRRRKIISFAAKRLSVTRMPAFSKFSNTRCRASVGRGKARRKDKALSCSPLQLVDTGSATELPLAYRRPFDRRLRQPISLCRTFDEEVFGVYRENNPHVAAWIASPGDAHRLTYALGLHRRS